jgi:hypothetical protein
MTIKTADQVAKLGPLHPFTGPELASNISEKVARRANRAWVAREQQKHWRSIPGQRHAKNPPNESSTKRNFLNC